MSSYQMKTEREDIAVEDGPAPGPAMTGLQYVAWTVAHSLVSSPGYLKATGELKAAFEARIEKELKTCRRTRAQLFVGTEPR